MTGEFGNNQWQYVTPLRFCCQANALIRDWLRTKIEQRVWLLHQKNRQRLFQDEPVQARHKVASLYGRERRQRQIHFEMAPGLLHKMTQAQIQDPSLKQGDKPDRFSRSFATRLKLAAQLLRALQVCASTCGSNP